MIETRDLTKIYNLGKPNEVVALSDVSLRLDNGRIIAFTGPSGCGKTTLLSTISLILTPTSGQVFYNNEDVFKFSDYWRTLYRRSSFGFIFQHINLLPHYTAMENVLLPLFALDTKPMKYKDKAIRLFERLGITSIANNLVEQLSGGEQQRVACIRAILRDPDYLFADEPTVFIDEESSQVIRETFIDLREKGKTIILSTHDQSLLKTADQCFRIRKGRILNDN